jgi:adenylate cyclase, class 2
MLFLLKSEACAISFYSERSIALSTETEVKIPLSNPQDLQDRLGRLGATLLAGRHFEENFILDFEDGQLREKRCLLRVRMSGGEAILTFKGPPLPDPMFKSREELETSLENGMIALQILERLGFKTWFVYQKYREDYLLDLPEGERIHVSLDSTPIGEYLELEGSAQGICGAARALEIDESEFLTDSYFSLYDKHCRAMGQPVRHMTFPRGQSGGTREDIR